MRVPTAKALQFEAVTTAVALTAGRKESAEAQRAMVIAYGNMAPGGRATIRGKYIKRPGGYVYLREDGIGRFFHSLPESAREADVIEIASQSAPLHDRLRALEPMLRTSGNRRDLLVADLVVAVLAGIAPERDAELLHEIAERANNVTRLLLIGQGDSAIDTVYAFFRWIPSVIADARRHMAGDGALVASLSLIGLLPFAIAAQASDQAISLVGSAGAIATLSTGQSVETLARGLCIHAVRKGYESAVWRVIETFQEEGNEAIRSALDGPWAAFHGRLYESAVSQMGVSISASAVRHLLRGQSVTTRYSRAQTNAEERVIRIEGSLLWAVSDYEQQGLAYRRRSVAEVRARDGTRAARLAALDLIENQLLYPRALLPDLLADDAVDGTSQC